MTKLLEKIRAYFAPAPTPITSAPPAIAPAEESEMRRRNRLLIERMNRKNRRREFRD